MKIIRTKEKKDYYDHIAKIYGEDPLIIFKQKMELEETVFTVNEPFPIENLEYITPRISQIFINSYIIVVCGVAYFVLCRKEDGLGLWGYLYPTYMYNVLTKEEFINLIDNKTDLEFIINFNRKRLIELADCCYKYSSKWELFHKLVDSPIFIIQGMDYQRKKNNYVVGFRKETVLLGDIGFSKIKYPLDMFLDMSAFISKSKSQEPSVTLDNSEKIVKSGFDLKQSFRHRK
jgi:hypothetical protein